MSAGAPPVKPQVKALNCPNCGAALVIRSFNTAVTIVCEGCHSILDAKDPNLQILQRFKVATDEDKPLIPLGTRGKIRGVDYEAIGYERELGFEVGRAGPMSCTRRGVAVWSPRRGQRGDRRTGLHLERLPVGCERACGRTAVV